MGLVDTLFIIDKWRTAIRANEKELPSFEYGELHCELTTVTTHQAEDGSYEPVLVVADRCYFHGFKRIAGLRDALNEFFDKVLDEGR